MSEKHLTTYERYRTEIYRIGWRAQYRAKKINNKELPLIDRDYIREDFTKHSIDNILMEQAFKDLPKNGKYILDKIYLQGFSEIEVARQLNMSQQAVNKWKRKMLNELSKKMNL
ncbi:sigma-70 family RNA polymerase sigma factor [Paenibacillus sp. JSM ZJ436]|uniref:terminase gpP N-terminus-related DNA-binding protein n=1 Tax=Paenibacillus sp. JSM ZJ436 TaxID=3376190 RepID=UPI00379F9114